MQENLFSRPDLASALNSLIPEVPRYVDEISEEEFLEQTKEEIAEQVFQEAKENPVVLDEEHVERTVIETQVDVSHDPLRFLGANRTGPFYVSGLLVKWIVPFTGDEEVFRLQTNPFSLLLPRGNVAQGKLVISLSLPNDDDSDRFKSYFEEQMKLVREFLGYANEQIERHNQGLNRTIEEAIVARKARIKRRKDVEEKI